MHSLQVNMQVVNLLSPVAKTATFTTSWVDRAGSQGPVALFTQVGADTGTLDGSNYMTATYEESDSTANSSATAVAAADMLSTFPVLNAKATYENTTQRAEYNGNKRYVRVKWTETGTVNAIMGMYAIKGHLRHGPSSAPEAPTAAT